MAEILKRQIAYKIRVGDLLKGKPIIEQGEIARFKFLELGNKNIVRVNVVANIIDKYQTEGSENKKSYLSLTIDDASGQMTVRAFGDDVKRFSEIAQGNTVLVIGTLRFFNNEIYISPEIIRDIDPRYLLVRKLELDKEKPKTTNKEEILAIKDQIIEIIKNSEEQGGAETEKIILDLKASPDLINQEITKLLEEGLIYEPRPGKIRYLG